MNSFSLKHYYFFQAATIKHFWYDNLMLASKRQIACDLQWKLLFCRKKTLPIFLSIFYENIGWFGKYIIYNICGHIIIIKSYQSMDVAMLRGIYDVWLKSHNPRSLAQEIRYDELLPLLKDHEQQIQNKLKLQYKP